MQDNSSNLLVEQSLKAEEETSKPIPELKELPKVVLPVGFEEKLAQRIVNISEEKPIGLIERLFFPVSESRPRILIYSTVAVLFVCCVFLTYVVLRNLNVTSLNKSVTTDTATYDGKKVVIIPPSTETESDQIAQQPLKKIIEPEKKEEINKKDLYKYFQPPATSVQDKNTVGGVTALSKASDSLQKSGKASNIIAVPDSLKLKKAKKNHNKQSSKPIH
jgi:hypothetical protein